jgi:4-hydroxyphenylacetate 3-monooxygenase
MKPEDFRADAKRPLTGEEYLKSLQDGREIYIYGERVKDVTTHPAFRNAASVAQLYDALHKPEMQDSLCWGTDTGSGGYTHKFFRVAKSADDLRQQRDAIAEWSRLSYGWMGRTRITKPLRLRAGREPGLLRPVRTERPQLVHPHSGNRPVL